VERGNAALRSWILDRIRARGPIPFVEYMDAALYHPGLGYYCRPGMTTGPAGDFYTSPDLHPAFGLLLSRQIAELADRTAREADVPFHIVEAGPGTGRLARDIIAGLSCERPELARRTVYTLVEVSPALRDVQRKTIGDHAVADVVWASWHDVLEGRHRGAARFHGCVLANEFLDALPVHLIEWRDGALKEVHVASEGDDFREELRDAGNARLSGHIEGLTAEGVRFVEGQRAEIGLRALDWVASLGRLFGREGAGGAILIDYGHSARELYDAGRHRGTLLCYHKHQVYDDPYARVGEQDMTAHVDFTSVARSAIRAGFDTAPPATQLRFLVSHGLAHMVAELAARRDQGVRGVAEKLALHGLMAPGGMGEVFKVMLLARGTEASALTGTKDPFRCPA